MKIRQNRQSKETGAVSLFVVMFTAMLFAAVTVGFTILMLSDQQQSTDNDLAQSALDSASAGAEDAKRVLAQYTDCVERNIAPPHPESAACQSIVEAVTNNECSTIQAATGEDRSKERLIKTTEDDSALDQAYTCVKITPNTDDYVGTTRSEGDIRLIPIKTDGEPVDTVTVQWLSPTDLGVDNIGDADLSKPDDKTVTGAGQPTTIELPQRGDWRDANRGALLRVGSIQYQPGNIDLAEIDRQARAVFLYPEETLIADSGTVNFATEDNHQPLTDMVAPADATPNRPHPSNCRTGGSGSYLCETIFKLPPGDASTFRYLTIASLYRDTSFRVTLKNAAGGTVQFRNVQPQVDVTGRANDVFRRIVSRVESADASEAPYPRAALGSLGSICKHYLITDDPDDYRPQGDLNCSTAGAIADPEAPLPATP